MNEDEFFKGGIELSDSQVNELINMLTKRCSHRTKVRLRSLITYDLDTLIKNCYCVDRFYITMRVNVTLAR